VDDARRLEPVDRTVLADRPDQARVRPAETPAGRDAEEGRQDPPGAKGQDAVGALLRPAARAQARGQRRDGGGLEEGADREVDAEEIAQAADDLGGEERV